ncbi:uncharacterized protein LOC132618540 [Lycium barbarum]|uniref:uncharacterized protein LOC132618540 n=1 Tax=Lycium barbarum TaxID=112863 RepID=UPI00293F05C3|nr:uncharacterized protein LOC132618540 [Lycium barbarum]
MPSGAKKRKAAKKKKKLGGNNNAQSSKSATVTNSHSHGEEDLRPGDNKETDGGEVSHLASQDHQLEISHSKSSIDENKSNAVKNGDKKAKLVAKGDGGSIQVERESKLEGESTSHNNNIEHAGPVRFPHEGGLRRRSSSSSKPAMSEDIVQVATSASDIDALTLHPIGSSKQENEKRKLGVMDEKTRASDVFVSTGLKKRDGEAVATSDAKPSVDLKDDDKLELSYDAPTVDASVHGGDINGSPHDHQPPIALGPRPAQTTSWKSCCGLFELFAGSNK